MRLALVLSLSLAAAGCGFRPMYGERSADTASPVAADLAAVSVGLIPDRSGQLLRNQLNRLLNPASEDEQQRYTLQVQLSESNDTFAVERSGFATRANIEMVARYTLVEDASGKPVLAGTSRAVSGYNLLNNDFSTVVAGGDARNRAIDQIAFEIRNRVASHFATAAASPLPPSSLPSPPAASPLPDETQQPAESWQPPEPSVPGAT